MSNAWETTTDDVLNVVHQLGKKIDGDTCHTILEELDQFAIENAALNGDDIDEQTQYAYDEMKMQIHEKGLV